MKVPKLYFEALKKERLVKEIMRYDSRDKPFLQKFYLRNLAGFFIL